MARTVPVSSTQVPGNYITGALWNAGPAASNSFLTAPPDAVLYQGVAQSAVNGGWTSVTFDSTSLDTDSQHSNVTNPSRFVGQVAGWHEFAGAAGFVSNATGIRGGTWAKNGTILNGPGTTTLLSAVSGNATAFAVPTIQVFLNVGDYIELQVFQNSGGALNTNTGQYGCLMAVRWTHV